MRHHHRSHQARAGHKCHQKPTQKRYSLHPSTIEKDDGMTYNGATIRDVKHLKADSPVQWRFLCPCTHPFHFIIRSVCCDMMNHMINDAVISSVAHLISIILQECFDTLKSMPLLELVLNQAAVYHGRTSYLERPCHHIQPPVVEMTPQRNQHLLIRDVATAESSMQPNKQHNQWNVGSCGMVLPHQWYWTERE